MTTIYDVPAADLIQLVADELRGLPEIVPPNWAPFVKTGVDRELPPDNPNWWYIRAAAVLRKIYISGPYGTRRLKSKFGGKKNRGVKQEKTRSGSGSIIRKILQQLEKAKLVKTLPNGRQVTSKGMSFLDESASKCLV